MARRDATWPSVLVALSCLCMAVHTSTADGSWRFNDVTTKLQAMERARGNAAVFAALAEPDVTAPPTTTQTVAAGIVVTADSRRGSLPANGTRGVFNVTVASNNSSSNSSRSEQAKLRLRSMFNDWALAYNLSFTGKDNETAFRNFCDNMGKVQRINSDPALPYWASGNAFSHMTWEDFQATVLLNLTGAPSTAGTVPLVQASAGINRRMLLAKKAKASPPSPKLKKTAVVTSSPKDIDWVKAGKVTPVKNQGKCRSCWAFTATDVIESMYLIKVGGDPNVLHLSEQQLLDCVNADNGPYNSKGCNSGWPNEAINYVADVNQTTASRYPYTGTQTKCNMDIIGGSKAGSAVRLVGQTQMVSPASSETALMGAVAQAPTVFYFAVDSNFMQYAGGIYEPTTCAPALNHAMSAVGYYTSDPSSRHWLIRNQWGVQWGESGYARIKMTGQGDGPCGMYKYAFMPPTTFISKPLTVV